jgi:hypothetical protein
VPITIIEGDGLGTIITGKTTTGTVVHMINLTERRSRTRSTMNRAWSASSRTLTSCGLVPEVRSVHRVFVNLSAAKPITPWPRPGCFVSSGSCDPE